MEPGPTARTEMIRVADTTIDDAEIDAVSAVLQTRWLSAGPVTAAFESEFAAALGVPAAVAVSSGTAALHLAVLALGLGPGDEVIMPSLSFVAAAAMVVLQGATPVFADSRSPDDLTVDTQEVAALVTPRTRAVIPMHYAGFPADMAAIVAVARQHGLAVVEDTAHAPVVRHPSGFLGTIGDLGCFSFFATKNLACGEGGMVVARDHDQLEQIRATRSHHVTTSTWARHLAGTSEYDVTGIGLNYRPTEISSAIGRVQLTKLAADRRRRAAVVARYRAGLADLPGVGTPFPAAVGDSAHHLFVLVLPESVPRANFIAHLHAAGVQTSVHYRPIHRLSYYRDRFTPARPLRVVEALADRIVSLPLHARLTDADAERVVDATRHAIADISGWTW